MISHVLQVILLTINLYILVYYFVTPITLNQIFTSYVEKTVEQPNMSNLQEENDRLKKEIEELKSQITPVNAVLL